MDLKTVVNRAKALVLKYRPGSTAVEAELSQLIVMRHAGFTENDQKSLDRLIDFCTSYSGHCALSADEVSLAEAYKKCQIGTDWEPMSTVPLDKEITIMLLTKVGQTEARFCPGGWDDHVEGSEYSGPVWSCCDDEWQIEIEEISKDPRKWNHGIATHWRYKFDLPKVKTDEQAP